MNKFIVRNLGNGLGDCFFIEIIKGEEKCVIMVDGHKEGQSEESFKYIKKCINSYKKIDCLIITHIDDDHIGGILRLLELSENEEVSKKIKDSIFIYNNVTSSTINYDQARRLEKILLGRKVINTCKNNYYNYNWGFLKILSFDQRVKFDPSDYDKYKNYPVMTFIHPNNVYEVEKVRDDYNRKKRSDGTLGKPHAKLVNCYSIVLLMEFMERRILLTGDANIEDISKKVLSLKNIGGLLDGEEIQNLKEEKNNKLDVIKIPHHGAEENNKGLCELAKKCGCNRFIITGEKEWNEKHPAKSLLNELYTSLGNKLSIYTNINMSKYKYCDDVIKNIEEINIMENE